MIDNINQEGFWPAKFVLSPWLFPLVLSQIVKSCNVGARRCSLEMLFCDLADGR